MKNTRNNIKFFVFVFLSVLMSCLVSSGVSEAQVVPGAQTSGAYVNADLNYLSIFGRRQLPLPAPSEIIVDQTTGVVSFTQAVKGQPEQAFVAAWRYCEHLKPAFPPGAHTSSSNVTAGDVHQIKQQLDYLALASTAFAKCHEAIARRIACPSKAAGALQLIVGSQQVDCVKVQNQLCQRLTNAVDDPNIPGMEIQNLGKNGDLGDEEANTALAQCQTDGISEAMYDYVMAHRCDNDNYVNDVLSDAFEGNSAMVEHARLMECPKEVADNEIFESSEEQAFLTSLQTLVQLRNVAAPEMNPISRPLQ